MARHAEDRTCDLTIYDVVLTNLGLTLEAHREKRLALVKGQSNSVKSFTIRNTNQRILFGIVDQRALLHRSVTLAWICAATWTKIGCSADDDKTSC